MQQAKSQSDIAEILTKVFEASDKSFFTVGRVCVQNGSSFENPFIPMSVLKQIRRSFYQNQDDTFEAGLGAPSSEEKPSDAVSGILPKRALLGLWDKIMEIDGKAYLPLSPVMFNEKEYLGDVDKKLEENPSLIVGLNNIAQVLWAKKHPEVQFFADVFLYTQNTESYSVLKARLPNLAGSYELDKDTPFDYTGDDYTPPLFISRVCLRHNGLNLPCKGCSRDNVFHLEQNGKHYKATCRNCITVVTKE